MQFSNIIWQVITPLIFSGLDILTGYIQAVINKNVDSKVMREGLLHKCLLIVAIVIGYVVQYAFNLNFVVQTIDYEKRKDSGNDRWLQVENRILQTEEKVNSKYI